MMKDGIKWRAKDLQKSGGVIIFFTFWNFMGAFDFLCYCSALSTDFFSTLNIQPTNIKKTNEFSEQNAIHSFIQTGFPIV